VVTKPERLAGVDTGSPTEGVTAAVALYEPVKFDPPPPVAPPTTNGLKFSGVPA
jgi:hypothetical protein